MARYSKGAETHAHRNATHSHRRREDKEKLGATDSVKLLKEAAKLIEGEKEETERLADDQQT